MWLLYTKREGDKKPHGILSREQLMYFEMIGRIKRVEIIAVGGNIRDIMRLRKQYGIGRWRKLKGIAAVKLDNGNTRTAEVHWYEAHGIGKRKMKIKRLLDE